jgi:molybdopterin synthase catalytic subunit
MESVTGISTSPASGSLQPEMTDGFMEGPVVPSLIAETIAKFGALDQSGAHSIFLGQVRADTQGGSRVIAIEYSVFHEMAWPVLEEIRQSVKSTYGLHQLIVFHSTGRVETGEICFFVMATAGHRTQAMAACSEAVNRIKAGVPVWGKLILENGSVAWKRNT